MGLPKNENFLVSLILLNLTKASVKMKRFLFPGMVFFLLVSFGSCKKKPKDRWDDTLNKGIINIACDENFKYLMDAEIDAFEAHNNLAIINPIYSNEKDVIRLMLDDSVRFVLSTRDLNTQEKRTAEEKRMFVRKFLLAFDGITLIINRVNSDSLIGLPTIKKILTGEITEWSQINSESPLGTIRVIFENNKSGILRYVADSLTSGKSLSSNLYAMNNSDELIKKVCELPNAIGILGYNLITDEVRRDALGTQGKLRLMRVGKEENATLQNTCLPYAGDIKNEEYPLWREVYGLLSDPKSGLSSGFSIFLAHDVGQIVLLKSGLLPAVTDPQNRSVNIVDGYPKEENKKE